MKLTDRLSASDTVVTRDVGGETILLDLSSGNYFGLDPVGSRIWELLEEAGCTLGEACDVLISEYNVDRDVLEQDVLTLAEKLEEQQLVAPSNSRTSL